MSPERDRRSAPRVPANVPVDYLADHFMGNGTMIDVSPAGMDIIGNYEVTVGLNLSLRIFLPQHTRPLYVRLAVVRWVRGQEFGVELLTLASLAQRGLAMFMASRLADRG